MWIPVKISPIIAALSPGGHHLPSTPYIPTITAAWITKTIMWYHGCWILSLLRGHADPILVWCWPDVVDGGPTLNQHWVNFSCCWDVSCLLSNFWRWSHGGSMLATVSGAIPTLSLHVIKGTYPGLKSSKNRWFYSSLLIWPYDVNMSID